MKPRPYQQLAVDSVFRSWDKVRSSIVVVPTGAGKTIIFAEIIRRALPLRTMVIAHREELIWQASDKIRRVSGVDCGVEMGDFNCVSSQRDFFGGDNPHVVVATVQTLNSRNGDRKRMGKFNPEHFAYLIIDECHHAPANTYQNVTNYFLQNPKLKVLGVTATPDRLDKQAMGKVFDDVAFDYEILDAIHDGWLVRPDQQLISIDGLDYSHVSTRAGDLNGAELAKVLETETNLHGVGGAITQIMGSKKTLVFTVSVAQAEVLAEIINRYKPGCATWVCGETPKDKRREIVAAFAKGDYQVVVNCDCFTEGFDDPGVQIVAMAKPTKSRAKYSQMIGRAMRPLTSVKVDQFETHDERKAAIQDSKKPCCEILDFVGNSGRHKLITVVDILGGDYSEPLREKVKDFILKRGGAISVEAAVDELERIEREKREAARQREIRRRANVTAGVSFTKRKVSPFDVLDMSPLAEQRYGSGKTLSEPQRLLLRKNGVDPDSMDYREAKALLDEMFRRWSQKLATYPQCKLLKRFGYVTKDLTQVEATRLIVRLQNNGWRKPKDNGTTQSIRSPQVHGGRADLPLRDEARGPVGPAASPPEYLVGSTGTDPSDDPEANGVFHQ